ncbi:DUF4175 family protein [Noviherbaspirillum galbum]|uniref:HAMP domain-containing protein n=1 Tax=Noviherbaspirillum galbum TaxID=2709383 RepID=A0A6B3SS27_9BURK|nr:DUF4175 family protein [Noviherbaspirillum galbum]NEX63740.1 HAMP domain-containing protein [Noviherbaspirillum galbum]
MHSFADLPIGRRLGAGFALTIALCLAMAAVGCWRMARLAGDTRTMMQLPLAKERMVADWYRNIYSGIRLGPFFSKDAQSAANSAAISDLQKNIEALLDSDAERAAFAEIGRRRKAYIAARDEAKRLKQEADEATLGRFLETAYRPAASAYQEAVQGLLELQRRTIGEIANGIDKEAARSQTVQAALGLLCAACGALFAVFLTRSVTVPLKLAASVAQRVAEGDLTCEVAAGSRDEAGQLLESLQAMTRSLRRIVTDVRSGTDAIETASAGIAAGNLDLSARTERQASALEQTASTIEEITAAVAHNADNARAASASVQIASGVAQEGGVAVRKVIDTMSLIGRSSSEINAITATIDGISFQINLLAINAAVEAARAGPAGRGFAVVASEVRHLAQRSAASAREIKNLIQRCTGEVGQGREHVDDAGRTMDRAVTSVAHVRELVGDIAAASDEQRTAIEQINGAIADLDQVTQQNATLVEQSAAAAQAMNEQARMLKQRVSVFRMTAA